jgi:pimeloyl-ACP methyl ester carboxylesterase
MSARVLENGTCHAGNGHAADEFVHISTAPALPLSAALSAWDREATREVLDTGRYRMPYFVWGSGPAVTFIHGLADRGKAFVPVMAAVRQDFTCIGYDLPVGGADGARLGAYRHDHLVDDLFVLLDHLGVRQSHVYGSSFGSTIVLAALHSRPDRTPRGIIQGGFAHRALSHRERILCQFGRYWKGPLRTMPLRERLNHPSDLRVFRSMPDGYRFHRENSADLPKAALARRGLMIRDLDLRPKLAETRQPVLMICGDCDNIVSPACEQPLLEGLPNVARVELPECGHYPHYTHAPLVAELVRQFLNAPACRVGA